MPPPAITHCDAVGLKTERNGGHPIPLLLVLTVFNSYERLIFKLNRHVR